MNEKHNFEVLVKLLSELWYKGDSSLDDELDKFEEAISKSGYGESAFGVARASYDRIEVIPDSKIKFYAEYYDGCQAPFTVCIWNKPIKELEKLLKEASPTLYKEYIMRLTGSWNK